MKLETTIPPRKDGQVIAKQGDAVYLFVPDTFGRLVADIDDEAHLAALLRTGNFLPADDADFDAATALMSDDGEQGPDDDFIDDGNVRGEVEDLDDDEGDMDAPLIEEPASAVALAPDAPAVAKRKYERRAK